MHAALSLLTLATGSLVRRLRERRGSVTWIGRDEG